MIFTLKSRDAEVKVLQNGAMLTSLIKDGIEYLWQGDKEYWAGQAPVCFPIVGVLPNGEGTAFGKKCKMNRHGVARINPFEVRAQNKNSITFIQRADDNTRAAFPFDYELEIKYTLVGSTVTNEYIIRNIGECDMPFVIGGHPAFNCPLTDKEAFEDYKVVFDKPMTKDVLRPDFFTGLVDNRKRYPILKDSNSIKLNHDLFEENDAMIFDNIESKCATLIGKENKGIKIEYQDMTNLLIWSACKKPNFVALEPWTGISNCYDETDEIEKKRGMTILEPNSEASFKFKITMI